MSTSGSQAKEGLSFGPYNLVAGERLLTRNGAPVELGGRALDILIALVSQPNKAISKKELIASVWPDVTVEESSLRFHVAGLRKALGDGKDGARYISTLAGRGYCFVAPVSRSRGEVEETTSVAAEFPYANLPGRMSHMVGRDEDIRHISARLVAARFVSIVGSGGVGKTTVAIAVGHHLTEAFHGAILFVDLSMLSEPGLVATAVASMLGLSVQSEDATPALVAYLRSKRMLLILDTCEHLIDAIASLASNICAAAPQVHILATSREVLQVEDEHVYRLDTLDCPPEDAEDAGETAQMFSAPRLFIERATASGARLDLADANVIAIVVRICRKLDGVALAIELAARRVEAYGLHQTETLLDQSLTLLLLGHRSVAPRQRTLQAAIDWSYRLLSQAERVVLRRLAVFVGHFTLDAALAVASDSNIGRSSVIGAIDSLVAKSMVATRPIGAMMRYRLLDTTRAYVLNVAIEDSEAAKLAARHATYYRRWLEQSGGDWPTLSTGVERSPHFAALNNTRSALEWCFGEQGDIEIGIKLAAAAAPIFLTMSLLPECYRCSERAIAALDDSTRGSAEEMQLQAALGVASMHFQGPSETALSAMNRSLVIAEARGNVFNQVAILSTLWLFCARQGEFKIALDHAKRARAVAGTVEELDATALARSALGMALQFMGDLSDARSELDPAFEHWSNIQRTYLGIDDRILVGVGLARTLWAQGFPVRAVAQACEIFDDAKLSSNPASIAAILGWIPTVFICVGDLRRAEQHADLLISYAESHSLGPHFHVGHAYKGILAICRGNAKAGVQTLRDCLKQLHATHYEMRNMEFNIFLTEGLVAIDRADEGMELIDETIRRVEETGERYFLPETLRVKGNAILAFPERRIDEAENCFIRSLELARHQGARSWELRTAVDLARLRAKGGSPEDGRRLLQPILDRFTEGHATADLQVATKLLAELAEDR